MKNPITQLIKRTSDRCRAVFSDSNKENIQIPQLAKGPKDSFSPKKNFVTRVTRPRAPLLWSAIYIIRPQSFCLLLRPTALVMGRYSINILEVSFYQGTIKMHPSTLGLWHMTQHLSSNFSTSESPRACSSKKSNNPCPTFPDALKQTQIYDFFLSIVFVFTSNLVDYMTTIGSLSVLHPCLFLSVRRRQRILSYWIEGLFGPITPLWTRSIHNGIRQLFWSITFWTFVLKFL